MKNNFLFLLFFLTTIAGFSQGQGNALDFDGVDDYVSIATPAGSSVTGNFTFEAWVQPKHATKNMHIFSSRFPSEYGFDLQILDGNRIHADIGNGSLWLTTAADVNYNYKVGVWFHIAYVVTNTGYRIYVNGQPMAAVNYVTPGTPLLYNSTHQMNLGRQANYDTYFRGALDNVRIYNTALTPLEVSTGMNSDSQATQYYCLANYTFTSGLANQSNASNLTTLSNTISSDYTGTLNSFSLQGPIGNWTTDRRSANVNLNNLYWTGTLYDAITMLNTSGNLTGDVTITIMGNTTETTASEIKAPLSGGYSSVTIKPSGNRTITGDIGSSIIRLNNTPKITIDGLNDGYNSLTIENTNTAVSSTILLTNSSRNTTISNCNLYGSTTSSAIVYINQQSNNLTISNCTIGTMSSNLPFCGISASPSHYSTGTTITGNNFVNIFRPDKSSTVLALYDMGANALVSNNKIYQTASRTFTGSHEHTGIFYSGNGNPATISGNTIGYASSSGTGFYDLSVTNGLAVGFIGIRVNGDYAAANFISIQNNTISGIKVSGSSATYPFTGIDNQNTRANITGNTIGLMYENGSIICEGLTGSSPVINVIDRGNNSSGTVNNNNIGGFTISGSGNIQFRGINSALHPNATNISADNNVIGGYLSNSINLSSGSTGALYGITGYGFTQISGNTIQHLTTNNGELKGIYQPQGRNVQVNKNTIHDLTHSGSGNSSVTGIDAVAGTGIVLNGNYIHTLSAPAGTEASVISGILGSGQSIQCFNNMISLGETVTNGVQFRGINSSGPQSLTVINNSLRIGGQASNNSAKTYALYSDLGGSYTRTIWNNILANNRSNNGSTGTHYGASIPTATPIQFDYNIYYGTGNGYSAVHNLGNNQSYASLENWKAFTTIDFHSYESNPNFTSSTNLHINPSIPTRAEGNGVNVSSYTTTDFDYENRSSLSPVDIGADAGNFTVYVVPAISGYSASPVCTNTNFTINGSGFIDVTSVKIGTTDLIVSSYTPTAISVNIPTAVSGNVTVTTLWGTATGSNLSIVNPPSITTQPVAPTTICAASGSRTIFVTASNATSYQWRKNGQVLVADATYTNVNSNTLTINNPSFAENGSSFDVLITGNGNCAALTSTAVVLTVTEGITVDVSASTATICNGQTSLLTASGAENYSWSPATGLSSTTGTSVSANPTTTTTYTVTGITATGCVGKKTITINVNPLQTVTVSPSSLTYCNNGNNTLTASGAISYVWSPASGLSDTTGDTVTATPSQTTTYTVTGTDANGCQSSRNVTVYVDQLSITPVNPTFCVNAISMLTANVSSQNGEPQTITWTPVASLYTDSSATVPYVQGTSAATLYFKSAVSQTYTVVSTNSLGCTTSATINVSLFPIPTPVTAVSASPTICEGGSTTIMAMNAVSYSWSPANGLSATTGSTVNANPAVTTTYTVTGTNENGCTTTTDITLTVNLKPTLSISPSNATVSVGDSVALTASGADSYSWSPATGLNTTTGATVTATPHATTTYAVTGISADGCENTASVTITTTGLAVSDPVTICKGTSVTLTAIGALNYSWSPATGLSSTTGSSVTASPDVTTTYTVTGTSGNVAETKTVTVTVPAFPDLNISPATAAICDNQTIVPLTLTATSGAFLVNEDFDLGPNYASSITDWTIDNSGSSPNMFIWGEVHQGGSNWGIRAIAPTYTPGTTVNSRLISPSFSTVGFADITLTFDYTYENNQMNHTASLDISTDGGITWSQLKDYRGARVLGGNATVSLNGYLNQPNVKIRFHYAAPYSNNYGIWTLDNVKITATAPTVVWAPISGLYTDANATIPYTGTETNIVYAKPSSTTTYTTEYITSAGCVITSNATVNVSTPPVLSLPGNLTICAGMPTTITASGNGAVSYSWSPPTGLNTTTGASVIASPTSNTTYTVTATSAGGCTSSQSITVSVYDATEISIASANTTVCANGSTTLTASGNVSGFTWSPADGLNTTDGATVIATPLQTTTYTVSGTDNDGCSATPIAKTITVTVGPALAAPVIVQTGVLDSCSGTTVTLSVDGASTPALQFDGNDDFIDIDRNIADDFTIEYWMKTTSIGNNGSQWYQGNGIVDAEVGGNANDFGVVLLGSKLGFGVGGGNVVSDTTIISNADVNTGSWTHVAVTRNKSTSEMKIYINGQLDNSGFSDNFDSLNSPTSIKIGGLLTGGNHFSGSIDELRIWNVVRTQSEIAAMMNASVSSSQPNLVDYFKFDENSGTTATNTVNIYNNAILYNSPQWTSRTVTIYDSFVWSTGATTPSITVSEAGDYSVEVINNYGSCTATSATFNVSETTMEVSVNASHNTICIDGNSQLTASGADSYIWSPSTGLNNTTGDTVFASPTVTTTYTVTGTYLGCTDTETITITVEPQVSVSATNTSIFETESTTLTATGASTYSWSPIDGLNTTSGASVIATPTTTTTYTVTGTSESGCVTTAQITIDVSVNTAIPYIIASGPLEFCPGGSVELTAAVQSDDNALALFPGAQYGGREFPAGDFTIEFLMRTTNNTSYPSGTPYYNGGRMLNIVDTSYNFQMGNSVMDGKFVFGIGDYNGSTIQIESTSSVNTGQWIPVAYSWSASNGEMKLYVNGIEEASGNSGALSPANAFLLLGANAFTGGIDNLRMWNVVKTPSEILQNSTLTTVTDTNNLVADYHFDEGTGNYTFDTAGNTYMYVSEEAWTVRPDGNSQYLWSNGATTPFITATTSGDYTVAVTRFGSTFTSSPTTVLAQSPTLTVTSSDNAICPGESTQLNAQIADPNYYYNWTPQISLDYSYLSNPIATPSETTTYTVTAMNYITGCSVSNSITIEVATAISVSAASPTICENGSTLITATGGTTYTWNPAEGLSATTGSSVTANPTQTTTYTVTGTLANGCTSSKEITITVSDLTASVSALGSYICSDALTLNAVSSFDTPAIEFSGDDQLYIAPNIPGDFTIEFWMKTKQSGNNSAWNEGKVVFGTNDQNSMPVYGITIVGTKLVFGFNGATLADQRVIESFAAINDGLWKHVAVTRSRLSGELQFYIDGQLQGTAVSPNSDMLYVTGIVGSMLNPLNNFIGGFDNLKIWDSVRTAVQIQESSTTTYAAGTAHLVSNFRFDENTGNQVSDSLNPFNNYTIYQSPNWTSRALTQFDYLWSTGETTPSIQVTTPGDYSVTISNSSCNATSADFTVLTSPIAAVTAAVNPICKGQSVMLTASGGDTYQWAMDPTLDTTFGANVIATPQKTTTYIVLITAGSCESYQQITLVVNNPIAVTPDNATICSSDAAVKLTATGGNNVITVLNQDFNSGMNGWTFSNGASSTASNNWKIATSPYNSNFFQMQSEDGGQLAVADAQTGGPNSVTDTSIVSPSFSLAGLNNATLDFETLMLNAPDDSVVSLDISTNGGTTWTVLRSYLGSIVYLPQTVNLYNYLGQTDVKLRFHYVTTSGSFWVLDAIKISSTAPDPVNWSPITGLYLDSAGTQVYSGEATNTVYAKPATTTEYTATAPLASACSVTASALITVNSGNNGVLTNDNQAVCNGDNYADIVLSGNTDAIVKWQKATNSNFINATDILSTADSLSANEIGMLLETTYIRAVLDATGCNSYSAVATLHVNATVWNGNTWNNGVPDINSTAIISGNYDSGADLAGTILTACSLIVTNNAIVSVNSNHSFMINGKVDVESGVLSFANNARLLQDPNATVNTNEGNISIQRNVNIRRLDYVYWGSPVAGMKLKTFSPGTVNNRFYTLNESTNSFSAITDVVDTTPQALPLHAFEAAKGYMIRASNFYNPSPTAPLTTFEGVFTGVPNNGNYSVDITHTAAPTSLGFNMISNPYPSPISAQAFVDANTAAGTLYFWTHGDQNPATNNYATWNALGVTPVNGPSSPNGMIQTGQGFLVYAPNLLAAGTKVNFTNSMRRDNNDNQFFRNEPLEKHRFWLKLSDATNTNLNQALIGYITGATEAQDAAYDGLLNYAGSSISSTISNNNYITQGRSLPFNVADIVPLSFNAVTAGNYTIGLEQFDGLFTDQDIFIQDHLTGAEHNLKSGVYTFASDAGNFNSRFSIVYQTTLGADHPTVDSNLVVVYKDNGVIHVDTGITAMSSVTVFDIRGRLLYEKKGINQTTTSLDDLRAEQQVLLVRVLVDGKVVVKRVL